MADPSPPLDLSALADETADTLTRHMQGSLVPEVRDLFAKVIKAALVRVQHETAVVPPHSGRIYHRRPECVARRTDGRKCRLHAGHDGDHVTFSSSTPRETWSNTEPDQFSAERGGEVTRLRAELAQWKEATRKAIHKGGELMEALETAEREVAQARQLLGAAYEQMQRAGIKVPELPREGAGEGKP